MLGRSFRGPRLPRRRPLLTRHRRLVAAGLLAVAAGVAVDAVAAEPLPGVGLRVAARDLPSGHRLAETDLVTVLVPAEAVPDGVVPARRVAGAVLAAPVRRGEPVTDARLVGPGVLTGAPPGTLAVPVRVAEPAALALLRPGDRVAVLAGPDVSGIPLDGPGTGGVVVSSAVVLDVVGEVGGGLLGGPEADGGVAVLALDRPAATRVAGLTGRRPLLVAVLP